MPEQKHLYRTGVRWISQRRGSLSSPGLPELAVATPPEFPGGHPGTWSPEHLFVAAAEVCLMTTFLAIAENSKLEYLSYSSESEGTLEKTDQGYLITEIVIRPRIVVSDPASVDRARNIVGKAERHCLISNSMKTRVRLEAVVTVE
jgi:organic hydroperoxide reductase OsmC/OhrA